MERTARPCNQTSFWARYCVFYWAVCLYWVKIFNNGSAALMNWTFISMLKDLVTTWITCTGISMSTNGEKSSQQWLLWWSFQCHSILSCIVFQLNIRAIFCSKYIFGDLGSVLMFGSVFSRYYAYVLCLRFVKLCGTNAGAQSEHSNGKRYFSFVHLSVTISGSIKHQTKYECSCAVRFSRYCA